MEIEVVGTLYHTSDIKRIMEKNPKYQKPRAKRTYEYLPYSGDVDLRREPNNPYDKQAVVVVVKGETIGYIPREYAAEIGKAISKIKSSHVEIWGGNYIEKRIDINDNVVYTSEESGFRAKVVYEVYESTGAALGAKLGQRLGEAILKRMKK